MKDHLPLPGGVWLGPAPVAVVFADPDPDPDPGAFAALGGQDVGGLWAAEL